MNPSPRAFTILEVLVVIAFLAILLALFTPATYKGPPQRSKRIACVNHLRNIDAAEQAWALEHNKSTNDMPSWSDLQPYLKTNELRCPGGGKYNLALVGQVPSCSLPEHQTFFLQSRRTSAFP